MKQLIVLVVLFVGICHMLNCDGGVCEKVELTDGDLVPPQEDLAFYGVVDWNFSPFNNDITWHNSDSSCPGESVKQNEKTDTQISFYVYSTKNMTIYYVIAVMYIVDNPSSNYQNSDEHRGSLRMNRKWGLSSTTSSASLLGSSPQSGSNSWTASINMQTIDLDYLTSKNDGPPKTSQQFKPAYSQAFDMNNIALSYTTGSWEYSATGVIDFKSMRGSEFGNWWHGHACNEPFFGNTYVISQEDQSTKGFNTYQVSYWKINGNGFLGDDSISFKFTSDSWSQYYLNTNNNWQSSCCINYFDPYPNPYSNQMTLSLTNTVKSHGGARKNIPDKEKEKKKVAPAANLFSAASLIFIQLTGVPTKPVSFQSTLTSYTAKGAKQWTFQVNTDKLDKWLDDISPMLIDSGVHFSLFEVYGTIEQTILAKMEALGVKLGASFLNWNRSSTK